MSREDVSDHPNRQQTGFNRYHVTDIDTGHSYIKFCNELKRCEEIAVALLPEVFVADVKVEDEAAIPEELGTEGDPLSNRPPQQDGRY